MTSEGLGGCLKVTLQDSYHVTFAVQGSNFGSTDYTIWSATIVLWLDMIRLLDNFGPLHAFNINNSFEHNLMTTCLQCKPKFSTNKQHSPGDSNSTPGKLTKT